MSVDVPQGRAAQIRALLRLAREHDSSFLPVVLGSSLGSFAVVFGLGVLLGHPVVFGVLAVLTMLVVATVVVGRKGNAAALARIEGHPGAAFALLSSMRRGDWRVTPAVAVTRQQDLVHRVVGRPGVILVAEGNGNRVRELLTAELRKARRVIGDTPMYDVVVGDGEGQVPLRRLQLHLAKLPRNLKPRDVDAVEARLKAVGGAGLPIPKGPLPTRVPRGKIR